MYWDINKSKSYNCLFNFIVGARGVGKTYGCKEEVIKNYIKRGEQFVYLRRYKEELKKVKKFFDDIADQYEDLQLKVDPPYFKCNGEMMGTAMALSTAKVEKSVPFPRVSTIIFDEFILDKGYHHYLPDEVTNFLEAYSTIARDRDVKVYFLSNALTMTNPYFLYFDISPPYGKDIKAQNDILIEVVRDDEYSDHMKKTRFAKIIEGTPYADYAIDNSFLRDDRNFVEKKSEKARYVFGMVYKGVTYGVWIDYTKGLEYVSNDVDPSNKLTYSLTLDDHSPNLMLLKGQKSVLVENFIKFYKLGLVRFENVNIKNICAEIIKLTI